MKKENVLALRNLIERAPEKSCSMIFWLEPGREPGRLGALGAAADPAAPREKHWECGTVGCLGGWTEVLMHEMNDGRPLKGNGLEDHRKFLEISYAQANELFYTYPPTPKNARGREITWKEWMLARLDDFLEYEVLRPYPEVVAERLP